MIAAAYRAAQLRIVDITSGVVEPGPRVAACPAWSVIDVVRHVTGVAADVVSGNVNDWGTDSWTAAQVDSRAGSSLSVVTDEWTSLLDPLGVILDDPGDWDVSDAVLTAPGAVPRAWMPNAVLNDVTQHEWDLRNALGIDGDRSAQSIHLVAEGYIRGLRPAFVSKGLPTLRIESVDYGRGWNIGREAPTATLRATSFELMRTVAGRRTEAEVAAMDWEGDMATFAPHVVYEVNSLADISLGERR